jgi:hypothetical protein
MTSVEEPDELRSISIELQSLQSRYKTSAQEDARQKKLLTLVSNLCGHIQTICNSDQKVGDIGIDVLIRINYDINECKALMSELNHKSWCCCLSKPNNPGQNRMCAVVRIRLLEAIYIMRASAIDARCGLLFDDVKQSNELADVISDMSGRTAILDLKDSWESKAAVQTSLLQLLHRIEKFNHVFTGGSTGSPDQNPKRIKTLQKFLATPPGSMSALKDYTQANRMLYDMASLGASLLAYSAGERQEEVSAMVTALKTAREEELRLFRSVLNEDESEEGAAGRDLISSEDEDVRSIAEYSVHYDLRVNNRLIAAAAMWSELQERLSCSGFLAPYFGNASGDGSEEVILDALEKKGSGSGRAPGSSKVFSSSKSLSQGGSTHGQSPSRLMDGSGSGRSSLVKGVATSTTGDAHSQRPVETYTSPPRDSGALLPSSTSPASVTSSYSTGSTTHSKVAHFEEESEPRMSARRRSDQQLQQPPRHRNSSGLGSGTDSGARLTSSAYAAVGVAAPAPLPTSAPRAARIPSGGMSSMMSAAASMSLPGRSGVSYPQEDGGPGGMKAKLFGSMSSAASKAAGAAKEASQKTRKVASIAAETTSTKVARAKEKLMGGNYSAIIDFDTDSNSGSSRSFY